MSNIINTPSQTIAAYIEDTWLAPYGYITKITFRNKEYYSKYTREKRNKKHIVLKLNPNNEIKTYQIIQHNSDKNEIICKQI